MTAIFVNVPQNKSAAIELQDLEADKVTLASRIESYLVCVYKSYKESSEIEPIVTPFYKIFGVLILFNFVHIAFYYYAAMSNIALLFNNNPRWFLLACIASLISIVPIRNDVVRCVVHSITCGILLGVNYVIIYRTNVFAILIK